MAAHKGPSSLRPRCTRSGSSVAAMPVYQSNTPPQKRQGKLQQNATEEKNFEYVPKRLGNVNYVVRRMLAAVKVWNCVFLSAV
jgi:hypothetical protein